ncbi:Ras guanine nucleotide exchange factor bud5 [Thecaphora frezii]
MAATASRCRDHDRDIYEGPYHGGGSASHSRLRPQSQSIVDSQPMDETDDTFFEAEQGIGLGEGSSSSTPQRPQPYRAMTSPMTFEDDSAYVAPEEHVVALHDFASSNSTCLSFTAGQVIKVFNRDSSGWWDGELDGQRGWFPSNYVDQEGVYISNGDDGELQMVSYADHAGADGYGGGYEFRYAPGSSTEMERYYDPVASRSVTPTSATWLDHGNAGVLDPILHAIALLHNAVRANRVAHFQPSTACVISSVRSVLSATDCLTRESPVLKAHPALAKERKAILSELSRLVAQARKASAPMVDETLRDQEMLSMLQMAENVLENVRRFLQVAMDCDVAVPERRSSVYDDLYPEDHNSTTGTRNRTTPDRREQDKTPTPDSSNHLSASGLHGPSQSSPRAAKSHGDLRKVSHSSRRKASGLSSDEGYDTDTINSTRSLSQQRLAGGHSMVRSRTDSQSDSPDSASVDEVVSRTNSAESLTEAVPTEKSPQEVMRRLSLSNDQLLSTIAAFIGHIHTHTAESHASSYARLIDMTREAVDGVRNLLMVVEAVNNNPVLRSDRPRETAILWETRESLYEATTVLVTAARVITSGPCGATAAGGIASETDDKSRLLQAATGVLRTGGECVGAVRLCIDKLDPSITIALAEPSRSQRARRAPKAESRRGSADDGDGDDEENSDVAPSSAAIRKGKHTLSFLGRKATSLTCLKEKYEKDDYVDRFDGVTEDYLDDEEDDGEVGGGETSEAGLGGEDGTMLPASSSSQSADAPRSRNSRTASKKDLEHFERSTSGTGGATKPAASEPRRMLGADDSTSDSTSEPMSREHSRTSGSTLQSARSDYTADTSARPSLELNNPDGPAPAAAQDREMKRPAPLAMTRRASEAPARSMMPISPSGSIASILSKEGLPPTRSRAGTVSVMLDSASEGQFAKRGHEGAEVMYNSEGQVTGATLRALVDKMTPHDSTVDGTFSSAFYLCFRMFTSPSELLEVLIARFDLQPSAEAQRSDVDLSRWNNHIRTPVRLRVLNFLKSWLESHWHPPTDQVILERLLAFTRQTGLGALTKPAQRLEELARKRLSSGTVKANVLIGSHRGPGSLQRIISSEGLKSGAALSMTDTSQMYSPNAFTKGGPAPPASIVSKALLSNLRAENVQKVVVTDFDPLELARQLTIIDSKLYCAIQPEELLGSKFSKESSAAGVGEDLHVKSMSSMSTRITGWVSECILGEVDARKRTQLVKFFIKLGDRCEALCNFHTLMAIQCALNSSTIARLKKTWDGLPQKYRTMMDHQRRAIEHTRNYAGYRARLRATAPPAVPFLGLFLTDLTFCHEGNAPTRPYPGAPEKKLLNFDKYVKISRIISEMQRFQVPYNLVEVLEIQNYLRMVLNDVSSGSGGLGADDLYRRSLLLEPRGGKSSSSGSHGTAPSPASIAMRNNGQDGKTGLDIFNWRTDKA